MGCSRVSSEIRVQMIKRRLHCLILILNTYDEEVTVTGADGEIHNHSYVNEYFTVNC